MFVVVFYIIVIIKMVLFGLAFMFQMLMWPKSFWRILMFYLQTEDLYKMQGMSRSEQKTLKDRSKQLVFFYVDVIVVLILKMIIGEVI